MANFERNEKIQNLRNFLLHALQIESNDGQNEIFLRSNNNKKKKFCFLFYFYTEIKRNFNAT